MNHAPRKKLLLLLLRCLLLWCGLLLLGGLLLWSSFLLLRSFLLGHSTSSVKKSQLRIPSRGLTDELTALTKTKTTFNSLELFVRYNIPNVEQSKQRSGLNLISKSSCTEQREFCNTFSPKKVLNLSDSFLCLRTETETNSKSSSKKRNTRAKILMIVSISAIN